MRNSTICFLILAFTATAMPRPVIADEDFSVVVNPRTGATFLRNDRNTPANIDGYLFVGDVNAFNTSSWNSLTDGSTPGWSEGQATVRILSEVNLTNSLSVPGHGMVPLGSPYLVQSPTAIGQPEPEFKFTISIVGAGVFTGDLEFEMDNNLVLVVDPMTGAATLENQSPFNVNINSYVIQSGAAALDPGGWARLQTSQGGTWTASTGTSSRIAEVNAFGSTFIAANGGSLSLGSPIDPLQLDDETDLVFKFSVAPMGGSGGAGVLGGVQFARAAAGLLGDFNDNGQVDAADYVVWRNNKDTNNQLPNDNMIGGTVGQQHYDLWRANFGAGSGSGSSAVAYATVVAVPEPRTGLCMALLTALVVGQFRMSTRRQLALS
jgi:hypothetical protein